MSSMKLHFLNARGALVEIQDWIHNCLTETHEKAVGLLPLQPLDIVKPVIRTEQEHSWQEKFILFSGSVCG